MQRKNNIRKIPSFRRNALQRKVPLSWRKPKGLFNKRKKGSYNKGKLVKVGYGQNRIYKNKLPTLTIHQSGKVTDFIPKELTLLKIVYNLKELYNIQTKEKECIILSGSLGLRKREQMIDYCEKNNIRIFPCQLLQIKKNEKK